MTMSDKICKHYWVTGKVQGVFFRANTQQTAEKLGITGWVRNASDGRVEVLACGTEQQLASFETWLRQGPPRARVDDLQIEVHSVQECTGFQIL